jgi:hypothetical protein
MREQAPGSAASNDNVEDGIEDLARRVDLRATGGLADGKRWDSRTSDLPLSVGEVGLVCSTHDARYPTEPQCQDPISDDFYQWFVGVVYVG